MGQGEVRLRRVRGERRGALQRRKGGARVAERGERLAQVAECHRVLRPAPERGAKKAHRVPELARLGQRRAMVGEKDGRLGIEREGAGGVLERFPGLPALPGDHAEQVVGVRLPRPRRDHAPVQALGFGEVARPVAVHALLQQRFRIVRRHAGTLGRMPVPATPSACLHNFVLAIS